MIVYEGMPGDPEDNATLAWPDTRKHVNVGTLSITQVMPQSGAECEKINFDPFVMANGIAPTNDPILLFRSPLMRFPLLGGCQVSSNCLRLLQDLWTHRWMVHGPSRPSRERVNVCWFHSISSVRR
jgi:hypothetical protein